MEKCKAYWKKYYWVLLKGRDTTDSTGLTFFCCCCVFSVICYGNLMVSGNSLPAVLPNPSELKKQPDAWRLALLSDLHPCSSFPASGWIEHSSSNPKLQCSPWFSCLFMIKTVSYSENFAAAVEGNVACTSSGIKLDDFTAEICDLIIAACDIARS